VSEVLHDKAQGRQLHKCWPIVQQLKFQVFAQVQIEAKSVIFHFRKANRADQSVEPVVVDSFQRQSGAASFGNQAGVVAACLMCNSSQLSDDKYMNFLILFYCQRL